MQYECGNIYAMPTKTDENLKHKEKDVNKKSTEISINQKKKATVM